MDNLTLKRTMNIKLIIPTLLLCLQAFAQEPSLDKFSFLLGSLNDYMGRYKDSTKGIADRYFSSQKAVLYHNYNLLKDDYPDLAIDSANNYLRSHILYAKVERYFKYKRDDGSERDDPTFGGKLNTSGLFKTKTKQLSYLAGAFIRYGSIKNETYTIRVANSMNVYPICLTLLKKLGCNITRTEIFKENTPVGYLINFEPTEEVKAFLLQYGILKH